MLSGYRLGFGIVLATAAVAAVLVLAATLLGSRSSSERSRVTNRSLPTPGAANWVGHLPAVNAGLNGLSFVFLVAGWGAIRRGQVSIHKRLMIAALLSSILFLACYLVYHAMIGGGKPFPGTGLVRSFYFTVLLSHVVLAVIIVPLVVVVLLHAWRARFEQHLRLARVTFPIWAYVSVTGVLVYIMLYQIY